MAADGHKIWLNQSDFAKRRGVNRATVNKWKAKGLLVQDKAGLVDVHETEWKLDERPPTYRGGVAHRPVKAATGNNSHAGVAKKVRGDAAAGNKPIKPPVADVAEADAELEVSPENLPMAEAVRRKENFLGLLRKHEFEIGQKEWVRIEDVGQVVDSDYATVRERLLVMPGKLAARLVGLSRAEIEDVLRKEATETLNELHDPYSIAGDIAAGDAGAAGKRGSEAAADPQRHRMG